jgi:c-di-GMP-binding flagellar brake protein YcgR
MHERRQHVRVDTPVMIEFPNPSTMKTEHSYTQDVSESGMRFPTTVKLDVGQEMPMVLQLPFEDSTLHATASVVWVREISRLGPPQYEIGVRFRWIEDPDRQRLNRHLSAFFRRRT